MTNHDAAVLGIRFTALYVGFEALGYFASGMASSILFWINPHNGQATPWLGMFFLLLFALLVAFGVFLFIKAPRLANYFVPKASENPAASPNIEAASVGFAIAGLVGLILSTPHLVTTVLRLFQSEEFRYANSKAAFLSQLPQMIGIFSQTILSFLILLKSRALATWWSGKQGY